MADSNDTSPATMDGAAIHVAPGPHAHSGTLTTRKMMFDVLLALSPVLLASFIVFRLYSLMQLAICVTSCMLFEALLCLLRRRRVAIGDLSAVVTGMILALSLPGTAPWYIGVIGSLVAIGIGKFVFGGLGQNIFNPAMVGRAFVMIAFAASLGAPGYILTGPGIPDAITQATPMDAYKQTGATTDLWNLFLGTTNGSLGETSALACILGGLYLCWRRTASWEIPLGVILGAAAWAGAANIMNPGAHWIVLHHILGGALLFGAFFIATDPVSSPLTPKGKFIFGLGIGLLVMLLRLYSAYPEGVMFAVLLMNGATPLINRWTIPRPVGGPAPVATKK